MAHKPLVILTRKQWRFLLAATMLSATFTFIAGYFAGKISVLPTLYVAAEDLDSEDDVFNQRSKAC
jgi:hypothetical protein